MLQPADKAPDFELPLLTGGQWHLSEALRVGPVLLAFFKISCPTCQLTFPYLQKLADSPQPGAPRVIAISQDNAGDTAGFHRQFNVSMPTLIEDSRSWAASNAYRISSVPSLFLIAPDGAIAHSGEGFSKAELEKLGGIFGVPVFGPEDRVPAMKPG